VTEKKAKQEDFPFDSEGFRAPTADLMGGPVFDGKKPNAYIDSFAIGLKGNQKVEGGEIVGK
jgi:nitrate/nitrite transport system substrate-binding protein